MLPLVPISAHLGNPTAPQGAVPPTLGTTDLMVINMLLVTVSSELYYKMYIFTDF
jgi:hypothetical protein